jgi:hypothetical protein
MIIKEMTVYELVEYASENYDEIEGVWTDLITEKGPQTTLKDAAIEWASRNGTEIRIVKDKK